MAQRTKLSGAALAAELSDLSFPQPGPQPTAAPSAPEPVGQPPALSSPQGAPPTALEGGNGYGEAVSPRAKRAPAPNPRGGRPAKAGVDGIPVNVRLSQSDHLALAKLAGKLMVPGRPLPTVQDVVRTLIRGALNEPELAFRLSKGTE